MSEIDSDTHFFDPDSDKDSDLAVGEYDIISSPNDFNVSSYYNFIESGAIVIPGFQRLYVWDLRKASKLIESILMGLPIPQIFLYEAAKNSFLVIDGQQRLMTIYYFMKGRFPKRAARARVRAIFSEKGKLDPVDLETEELFSTFRLSFSTDGSTSPYAGLTYAALGDLKATFDLRTIRNIMVKQVRPDDDSSIFELFNRLNTGGVNLSQQEIRMSLFYGPFVKRAVAWNEISEWRSSLGREPDPRQKDVEVILRLFALTERYADFRKPLTKFINDYCKHMRMHDDSDGLYTAVFRSFVTQLSKVDRNLYLEPRSKRVSVPILEAAFVGSAEEALKEKRPELMKEVDAKLFENMRSDSRFDNYFTGKTTDVAAVHGRIEVAKGSFS